MNETSSVNLLTGCTDEDIVVALSILEQLPRLNSLLQTKPNIFLTHYIFSSIGVVNSFYRKDPSQNEFVDSLLSYWRYVLSGRWRDANKYAIIIANWSSELKKPPSRRFLPVKIILPLLALLGLFITVLALIAANKRCCSAMDIVSIILSAVGAVGVIVLFPLIYKTYQSMFLHVTDTYTDLFVDTIVSLGDPKSVADNPLSRPAPDNAVERQQASEFILDKELAFHNKKQVQDLLVTAAEDEGNFLLKPKGLPPALASLTPVYRHTIIIMSDYDGKIVLFSEGAVASLGFSSRDIEGRNINTLLFGEKSIETYATMMEGEKKKVDVSEKLLILAHQTLGSVSISANVVMTRDAESNEPIGFTLIGGVHSDELARTQSLFHHFFVRELLQLRIKDPQFKQIVNSLDWKSLRDLATSAKEWRSTHIRKVLSDIAKGRAGKVDVEIDPKVFELPSIKCDGVGIASVLARTSELFSGKLKIRVESQRTTEAINQLIVIFQHNNASIDKQQLKLIAHMVNDMGGFVLESPGTLRLQLVVVLDEDGIQVLDTQRNNAAKSTGSDSLVVLLLEKNALNRHNISNFVWNCGHSLRIVENAKKALQAIENSSDLSCAIIDIDMKDAERVIELLISKHIYSIETSETPGAVAKRGDALLKKPINRDELVKEFENAAKLVKRSEAMGKIRNSPWTKGRLLGRGGFASVYEATSTLTGGKMAVKIINMPNDYEDRINDFVSEIEILCSLDHPNIIHYFYCESTENTLYLFMALANQGTVADLLKKYPRLPDRHIATLMKQLLQAINYLHEADVVHRDIKPANMLLSNGQMKLSDFGTATTTSVEGMVGTLYYMAPEVVDGKQSGKASDIWSIGCVASECLQVTRSGGLLGYEAPTKFPADARPELVDFIQRCTQIEPGDRATASALLLHDFIAQLDYEVEDLSEVSPEDIAKYTKAKKPKKEKTSDDGEASSLSVPSWSM